MRHIIVSSDLAGSVLKGVSTFLLVVKLKMLAKEIVEDSLLSFLTQEVPELEADGEMLPEKVQNLSCYGKWIDFTGVYKFNIAGWIFICGFNGFDFVGSIKNKGGTVVVSSAGKDSINGFVTLL